MPELTDLEVTQLNEINRLGMIANLPVLDAVGFKLAMAIFGYDDIVQGLNEQIESDAKATEQMDEVNPMVDPEIEREYGDDCEDVAEMLGKRYMDNLTALVGTAVMVGQTLEGTVEALLQPKVLDDNKLPERVWVNIDRLSEV